MGALVNAAIPFVVGAYCLLVGFRIVGSKPGGNPATTSGIQSSGSFSSWQVPC
jgi:hypothetical protein